MKHDDLFQQVGHGYRHISNAGENQLETYSSRGFYPHMKTIINWKSAALGLCIGVVAVLAIGAAEQPVREVGRYQIAITGNPATAMVIDTATGRVWGAGSTQVQLRSDGDFFSAKSP